MIALRPLSAALFAALLLSSSGASAQSQSAATTLGANSRSAVTLTLYNGGFGQVSEERRIALPAGRSRLVLKDLAASLRAETLSLSGPGLAVIEQSLSHDPLTPQTLLEAHLGKEVRIARIDPETGEETVETGRLLSVAQGPIIQIGDRIETEIPGRMIFDELPPGLSAEPQLSALVESGGGSARLALDYIALGLGWQADYRAEIDEAEGKLNLVALVSLSNDSGVAFENAKVRLIAGSVQQLGGPMPYAQAGQEMTMTRAAAAPAKADVAAVSFSDRHLYLLPEPLSLAEGERKQITLFSAESVAMTRGYRLRGLIDPFGNSGELGPQAAEILVEVGNEKAVGLGRPLPAGALRVYEAAAEGPPVFTGESRIDHTPEGERLELTLGEAFDVTGRSTTTAHERLSSRAFETAQEIVLANAKDEAVDVLVEGPLARGWNWSVLEESQPHEPDDAGKLSWRVTVPASGEVTLSYRVRATQ